MEVPRPATLYQLKPKQPGCEDGDSSMLPAPPVTRVSELPPVFAPPQPQAFLPSQNQQREKEASSLELHPFPRVTTASTSANLDGAHPNPVSIISTSSAAGGEASTLGTKVPPPNSSRTFISSSLSALSASAIHNAGSSFSSSSFSSSSSSSSSSVSSSSVNNSKLHVCTVCSKVFTKKYRLNEHARVVHGPLVISCSFEGCDRKFSVAKSAREHEKGAHGLKNLKCTFEGCGKLFRLKHVLDQHVEGVHGEKTHICTELSKSGKGGNAECGAAFRSLHQLKLHKKGVHGPKTFHCPRNDCEKAFTTSSDRTKHANAVHGDRTRFRCAASGCGKTFSTQVQLNKHSKSHTEADFASASPDSVSTDSSRMVTNGASEASLEVAFIMSELSEEAGAGLVTAPHELLLDAIAAEPNFDQAGQQRQRQLLATTPIPAVWAPHPAPAARQSQECRQQTQQPSEQRQNTGDTQELQPRQRRLDDIRDQDGKGEVKENFPSSISQARNKRRLDHSAPSVLPPTSAIQVQASPQIPRPATTSTATLQQMRPPRLHNGEPLTKRAKGETTQERSRKDL